jgi:amino acid transporter
MVPISVLTYFLPTACALAALNNWQDWHTGFFSNAAQLIGGHWLGFAMTIAAAITNISLFNSTVLTSTRMPSSMAEDGYLSPFLTRIHPKYGTPWMAILVSAACYAALAWGTLTQLISIYVWLRVATSVLTAEDATGSAASLQDSMGKCRRELCRDRDIIDECGGVGWILCWKR